MNEEGFGKVMMACFKAQSLHLSGRTKEKHKKFQSELLISGWDLNQGKLPVKK
jgi:hypothetical protein